MYLTVVAHDFQLTLIVFKEPYAIASKILPKSVSQKFKHIYCFTVAKSTIKFNNFYTFFSFNKASHSIPL